MHNTTAELKGYWLTCLKLTSPKSFPEAVKIEIQNVVAPGIPNSPPHQMSKRSIFFNLASAKSFHNGYKIVVKNLTAPPFATSFHKHSCENPRFLHGFLVKNPSVSSQISMVFVEIR